MGWKTRRDAETRTDALVPSGSSDSARAAERNKSRSEDVGKAKHVPEAEFTSPGLLLLLSSWPLSCSLPPLLDSLLAPQYGAEKTFRDR